jgi:hypothetical protein
MSKFCFNCITARKKFRIGDQVILNVEGCRQLPDFILRKSHGKVVGFGDNYNLVRIKFPYIVKAQTLHCGFFDRK